MSLEIGQRATAETIVTDNLTARAMGSGSIDVYATPAMIALMEKAAVNVIEPDLDDGQASVGIEMNVKHLKASATRKTIIATATITAIDDKRITLAVQAHDGDTLIGEGVHIRYIIDVERFLSRL